MIRVLFVDDEQRVLDGLQRLLRRERGRWEMDFALGGPAALNRCVDEVYDLVVTDMRMPEMDGAALLSAVQARHPATVRFLLSGQTQPEAARRAARVAHQFLTKPTSAETLRARIGGVEHLRESLSCISIAEAAGRMRMVPASPSRMAAVRALLLEPKPRLDRIADAVAGDIGIAAKLLQLVNSSFFGHGQAVGSIRAAVDLLGATTIRELVSSDEIFGVAPTAAEQLERTNDIHGAVARSARDLAPPDLRELAYTAALLRGLGDLIRSTAGGDDRPSGPAPRPTFDVDAANSGLSRDGVGDPSAPELGAYLLGLWNLPPSLIAAVRGGAEDLADPETASELVRIVREAESRVNRTGGDRPTDPVEQMELRVQESCASPSSPFVVELRALAAENR